MGYGDKKVVIEMTELEDGAIEHTGPDGLKRTYYPGRQIWLDLQDLQVWQHLRQHQKESEEGVPNLVTQVRGEARLEDYDLSIIGELTNKTRSVRVAIEVGDVSPALKEVDSVLGGLLFNKPMGVAQLGFSRADWEIGNSDEWWLSCYVTEATLRALSDAVATGALQSLKLGLRLKDLYTTEHPMAPISGKANLFLRPNRSDNTIECPECATGYIMHLSMSLARVDMRPTEVKEDDEDQEHMELREVPLDPVAVAVAGLTASVGALRHTIKWVGGIAAVCLVILALK
ncbi:hypothetical protein [Caenimonas soli]|uniref:hypothetical protein n=1 Tax=Caenimonas soli TaxID=2735555 RepID=UPI001554D909|nr:hypothetical protein [Caenimonas soli]